MKIEVISAEISNQQLRRLAQESYGEMVKAVVDVEREILAIGGELHADAESVLLDEGSRQEDLWGINLYPDKSAPERIEYTALINIRPRQKNLSMEIEDSSVRERIRKLVDRRVRWS